MCIEPNLTLSTIAFVVASLGALVIFIKVSLAVWRKANRPARYPGE
jgi:hypothetical protein